MIKKSALNSLWAIAFPVVAWAQNPVIQTHYTPDPAPLVYKDAVYLYTGDDQPGTNFYHMTKWRIHSSTDLVNWTDHGVPISLESFSWARDRAWAAQCIERNEKFYWYICAQTVQNNMAIGVAVADKPTGPFRDALGKPLITTGSWSNIDPTVYIDDDGQAYLYWGNNNLYYAKLNADMVSLSNEIMPVPLTLESFGGVRSPQKAEAQQQQAAQDMFVEGPWFYKRNGRYYLMYAGMTKDTECLSYAISDNPTGPWRYQGKIMTDQPTNSFTNHGGIIDFRGKSYLFYHMGLLPGGGSYGRSTAIETFNYGANGTIPLITMTKNGVEPQGKLNPYRRVEAETMSWSNKCRTDQDTETGVYVTDTHTGGYIRVREVDFGAKSPTQFNAMMAAGLDGGILEVHADSLTGTRLSLIRVPRTGGWQSWKLLTAKVETPITGVHDVYLVFKGENITPGRALFNFDYWYFKP